MKRPSRVRILHLSFLAFASCVVIRSAYVQLWQRNEWRDRAAVLHNRSQTIPAPRGQILDASGTVLVESRPLVQLGVAPKEVRKHDRERLIRELAKAKVPRATLAKLSDTSRAWVTIPGRFLSADVAGATTLRGVHVEPVFERIPSPLVGLRGLVGHAAADGAGIDGIELALDTLLRGVPGRSSGVKDGRGTRATPQRESVAPIPGHSVTLTIRLDLQDIAEQALSDALQRTGARGGDIVVLDPKSGALLALASRRSDPRATAATALTEPVEPGSTLKPFVAAELLARGLVQLDEVFETYNGEFKLHGIRITDVHRAERMTFSQVIEYSSNIGMAQAAERLTPREEYEGLRNFGFGTPTGLPFPSEAAGKLYEPRQWSLVSQSSLARGYEILVTPVQLAVAYGAIANGGELLQPALIKEIRDAEGNTVYKHQRQVVRRAVTKPIAAQMRALLRSVVDSGSAMKADLAMYEVGGKSGTARRTENGKYVQGDYTATFVGLFPADEPQLVVLVKLDSPSAAAYYGGQIAAPVTKVVLEAALASSDAVLDRSRLRPKTRPPQSLAANSVSNSASGSALRRDETSANDGAGDGSVPYVLNVKRTSSNAPAVLGSRPVPDVQGLSVRGAAAALHRAGLRVRLVRGGDRGATAPAAGTVVRAGTLVRLNSGP